MNVLYICGFQFYMDGGKTYALPAYGDKFWLKYLEVFDSIHVLGGSMKSYLKTDACVAIQDDRIRVDLTPNNAYPQDFKNDRAVKHILREHISKADAIIIKPSTRKGMMAIRIAKYYNKPYMIELTGDIYSSLINKDSIIKKLYAPVIYLQTRHAIKDCKFGLYVTEHFLQEKYPIRGEQCGCTDTFIEPSSDDILYKRLRKIDSYDRDMIYKVGLVATYHDNRKGLDTAIRSIAEVSNVKVELHILGTGVQEDRDKWLLLADEYSVRDKVYFDAPLNGLEKVLEWNDDIDLIILPSKSEGLPRSIVESISRGCPCIVSNVCGLPELVNSEWLHSPKDYKKLGKLISRMLSSKELMKVCAIENFQKSKKYDPVILSERRNKFLHEFRTYAEAKSN